MSRADGRKRADRCSLLIVFRATSSQESALKGLRHAIARGHALLPSPSVRCVSASSSGLMLSWPLVLRVIHASSKAVSTITRVWGSKEPLPKPCMGGWRRSLSGPREQKGAYVSSPPHQIVLVTACCNGHSPRVQMTAAIAVEGEERPDIRRNACNQVGHAMLGSAIQFTQQFIADPANLILGHPLVGKHGKFPRG